MNNKTLIQYECDDFLIAFKPHGIPTLPVKNSDKVTLLDLLIEKSPNLKNLSDALNCGVLHRLDNCTEGLVLVAKNKKTYDFFIRQQIEDKIQKNYVAYCSFLDMNLDGFPKNKPSLNLDTKNYEISSFFRPFGIGRKSVRPVDSFEEKTYAKKKSGNKIYKTKILNIETGNFLSLKQDSLNQDSLKHDSIKQFKISCVITNGFRHQIRSHLAWASYPIIGDLQYGGILDNEVNLSAIGLSFLNPNTNKNFSFFCE